MYTGYGFRDFEIGDVDVIRYEEQFHLFHLVLPNHDYIAHAISDDGLNWRRVKNALFISDPGAWDDDMLWTMHVSRNPFHEGNGKGAWRMFYTGLCLQEQGRIQRIGVAYSDDLYTWRKAESDAYPVTAPSEYYESSLDEGRHWVSFRDPFYIAADDHKCLLVAARINEGPIIRRGCVALLSEEAENQFVAHPPLFHPGRYDDVEVPNVIQMGEHYYLIGSIREDVKVHYWYAHEFAGPYRNFADNVLMPQGNYAARICYDPTHEGGTYLIWNFFFVGLNTQGKHLLAPPKQLVVDDRGELRMKSYFGFNTLVERAVEAEALTPFDKLIQNPYAGGELNSNSCGFGCESGFEVFQLAGEYENFRLNGTLFIQDQGKCGLALHLNEEGDGYYISLDLFKGIVQVRAWQHNPDGGFEEAFSYDQLQGANYVVTGEVLDAPHPFSLVVYEQYIELSLHGYVLLTLVDGRFSSGRVGFYVESGHICVDDLRLEVLSTPESKSYMAPVSATE